MHISSAVIASAIISFVLALPTELSDESNVLSKRGNFDTFGEWTGSKCSYNAMTDGTYVRSGDTVDTNGPGPRGTSHCWTDLVYMKTTYAAGDWSLAGTIDCGSTQTCASGSQNAAQTCSHWSFTVGLTETLGLSEIGSSIAASQSYTVGKDSCKTATSTNQCTWNDQQCHSTWTSTVMATQHNFIRRKCNFLGGAQNELQWSKDLDLVAPTTHTEWGCAGTCSSDSYPSPLPAVKSGQ